MLSPIRRRALVRELRQSIDRQAETSRSQPHDARGVITPASIPIPPITPVPAGRVELIPTIRLTHTTKDTGEIDSMTITQEDKQASEHDDYSDLESIYPLIRELQEKLQTYQCDHNQRFPPVVRMSMNKLMPLYRNKVVKIVFKLAETDTFVELDPDARDDIQCCDG